MSSFTEPLAFVNANNGIILTRDLTFYYNDDLTGSHVTIPAGHYFNGASIPKPIQKIFGFDPFNNYWIAASVVHDALIGEFDNPIPVQPDNRVLSWNEAAKWFEKALKVNNGIYGNCPLMYRILFVNSVKVYGFFR